MGLTFDDVLLVPAYSEVLPSEVTLHTRLTTDIHLNIPLVSAAMDSVTEARAAMAMARHGGCGIIHKNMDIQAQAAHVRRVKRSESSMILDPVTVHQGDDLSVALETMRTHGISGLPVLDDDAKCVGILTHRDVRFAQDLDQPVSALMTRSLVTASADVTSEQAQALMHAHRIEKLLILGEDASLVGLMTIKDIQKHKRYPQAANDVRKRLIVGAAVGTGADTQQRADALVHAGVDVLVVDTAHGHSRGVLDAVALLRERYPHLQLIAGNVATGAATGALIEVGVNAVKVGIGPGSICTTRVVAGVGVPQLSAVLDCVRVASGKGIPVIADGGIKTSGDVVKAMAAGASSVMIGSLFAGTDEAPGEKILYQGRTYKMYRGMGSIGAMRQGSSDRYFQEGQGTDKLVPEGVEGRVPYRGSLGENIHQLIGGLRSGMGYVGAPTLKALVERAEFMQITQAGYRESHVHDVIVTKESPNYRMG